MTGTPLQHPSLDLKDYYRNAPRNPHQRRRYRLVDRLLSHVPAGGRALDYGCGLGDLTHHVSSRFDSILGVDVTPERVERARRQFAPLQFEACDGSALEYADGSFDTVLSVVVLNWVDDPVRYLAHVNRVLVAGGHLLIVVRGVDLLRNRFRRMRGKAPARHEDFTPMGLQELLDLLDAAGFIPAARDCFYDPLADVLKNPRSIALELIKLPVRLFNMPACAPYFGLLARKKVCNLPGAV